MTHLETLIPDHLPHHEVDDNVFYPAPMWEVEVAAGVAATTIPWDEQTGEAKQVQLARNDKLAQNDKLDDSMSEAHALNLNPGDLNEAAGAGIHNQARKSTESKEEKLGVTICMDYCFLTTEGRQRQTPRC